ALRAVATSNRSAALAFLGESELAQRLVDDSIPLARAAGLHWVETLDLGTRAALAISRGDLIAAEQDSNLAVQVAQQGRDPWASAMALNSLGDLMRARGDTERAGPFYEEARALFVSIDPHRNYEPQGLVHNLAYVALARGEVRRAADLFVEGAEMYLAVG